MNSILQPNEGERLTLGAPFAGELIVKTGGVGSDTLVLASQTLLRGTAWPSLRHLTADVALFVHKGQGRASVAGQSKILVPGVTVVIPRGVWHDLRNTGTGLLLVVWTSSSSAVSDFFREGSRAGGPADLAALHAIGQRHGVEFRGEEPPAVPVAATSPGGGRRRRRHCGRGARARNKPHQPSAPAPHAPVPVAASSATPPPVIKTAPPKTPAAAAPRTAARPNRSPRDRRRRGYGGVKEVFMGGRWVRVSGEGPVISE